MSIETVLLTGHSNFQAWKDSIEDQLLEKGLWGLISGSTKEPTICDREDNVTLLVEYRRLKKDYEEKVQQAVGILRLSLNRSLCSITTKQDPLGIYGEIITYFEKKDSCCNIKAFEELIAACMASSETLHSYLDRLRRLFQRIELMNFKFPEDIQVGFVLRGLADHYKISDEIIRSQGDINWDSSIYILLQHKSKINTGTQGKKHKGKEGEQALSTESKKKKQPRSKPDYNLYCWFCDQKGHSYQQCYTKSKPGVKPKGTPPTSSGSSSSSGTHQQVNSHELLFAGTGEHETDWWYIDSGATSHMTHNRKWFTSYHTFDDHHPI